MNSSGKICGQGQLQTARSYFSLSNLDDRFIFIMGYGTAERFDIERGVSETLPNMKERRNGAASCALNGSVYVFFGQDDSHEPISNYEKLEGADGPAARARFVLS